MRTWFPITETTLEKSVHGQPQETLLGAVEYDQIVFKGSTVVVDAGGAATVVLGNNVSDDNPPGDATYVIADRVLFDLTALPSPKGTVFMFR